MNIAYVHLVINHFPPILAITATVIVAFAMVLRNQAVLRTGAWVMVAATLFGIPTFLTGDPTEEQMNHTPGVVAAAIEPHAESADFTLVLLSIAGVLSLGALFYFRGVRSIPVWAGAVLLVAGLAASGAAIWTAHLGGLIRHPEAASLTGQPKAGQPSKGADDD